MNVDERLDLVQTVQGELWEKRMNETHKSGRIGEWVSTFHPDRLPCWLADPTPVYGSYNAGLKYKFSDGSIWLLRFARAGKVHDSYADEKVAMEVAAINLIRRETTIPVPDIKAWGVAAQNPLGLGPFILMDFIQDGISLGTLVKDLTGSTRLLREDLSDEEMEIIYRQFANFLLQLFKLDFDHIGTLDSSTPGIHFPIRPLTWKSHDILQTGGVNTFGISLRYLLYALLLMESYLGDRNEGFSSTTEYFQYVFEQDWEQLIRQSNSAYGPYDAMAKYQLFKVLKSSIPDFVHKEYDRTKFKLICDDLGLANLMVRSRQDLTVVGVVDLEWSYSGPAQLFGSAPWWLLMDRPTNQEWDCNNGELPGITTRYFKYLDIFKRVLEEEESKMQGHENKELSNLVRWSESSGAMWAHMLLSTGFNGPREFPFTMLVKYVGADEWERRERCVNQDEVEAFGAQKALELERYKRDLERIQAQEILVDNGKLSKEDFFAQNKDILPS